jgi:hypothetical protein
MIGLASLRSLPGASHGKLMIVTAATVIGLVAAPVKVGVSWAALQASPTSVDGKSSDVRPHDGEADRTRQFVIASRGPN